jgi:hypothetical protein
MNENTNPVGNPRVSEATVRDPRHDTRQEEQGPAEFQRFENLTRKVAQVPKAEVDEKRKTT